MRVAPIIVLAAEDEKALTKLSRSNTASVRLARWRQRFAEGGMAGIKQDLPRGGRTPTVDAQELVRLTTQTKPENPTHWSTRTLAEVAGVSATTVRRVWRVHGLKATPCGDLQSLA
jgi:transposase